MEPNYFVGEYGFFRFNTTNKHSIHLAPAFETNVLNITIFDEVGLKEHTNWIKRAYKNHPERKEKYLKEHAKPVVIRFPFGKPSAICVDTIEEAIQVALKY